MMFLDDNILVEQCLNGRKDAFERLVERYQKLILNLSFRMCGDFDDAEDITQSVFLKAYNGLSRFDPAHKFYSWMYRIAMNESINHVKKKSQTQRAEADLFVDNQTPEDIYARNELSSRIQAALMRLDPMYRAVIVLRHFRHCSYEEIATILEIPVKTVKSRLFSARKLLRDILVKN